MESVRTEIRKPLVRVEFVAKDTVKAVRRGDVIIVIDVLRCSSTIITALASGARGVIPAKTLREARALHKEHPEYLLAGERRGIKPIDFDLGNSPIEFSPEKVKERYIILTTTSGAKAITLSKNAKWVLIGSLLNAEAVAKAAMKLAEEENVGVSLVLSGRSGRFSLEDFICAGAIAEKLLGGGAELSDAALAAKLAFQQAKGNLIKAVRMGYHARYLESIKDKIGTSGDIEFCCQLNAYPVVPVYRNGIISRLSSPPMV